MGIFGDARIFIKIETAFIASSPFHALIPVALVLKYFSYLAFHNYL